MYAVDCSQRICLMEELLVIPEYDEFVATVFVLAFQNLFHRVNFVFCLSWLVGGPKRVTAVGPCNLLRSFAFGTMHNNFSHTQRLALIKQC